jgi:3-dehydroquinate synthase
MESIAQICNDEQFASEVIAVHASSVSQHLRPNQRYFIVYDSGAKWFVKKNFSRLPQSHLWEFSDPSEEKKSMETVTEILDFLFEHKADRSAVILAIGGGATLDTAGFSASIYKRGLKWYAIPTTLLSQVDASVGGKTAVNQVSAKNAIGAFHPPEKVFICPEVSESWNNDHWLEGFAEMLKIFICFDCDAVPIFVCNPNDATHTRNSIALKAKVVSVDPREENLRAALNYGHTFAHALEHFTHMPHGIAVAYGMHIENFVAVEAGIMRPEEQASIATQLRLLGFCFDNKLPTFAQILPFMQQDKKNRDGKLTFCLPDGRNSWPIKSFDPRTTLDTAIVERAYLNALKHLSL